MSTLTVTTQADLDTALAAGVDTIIIDSPRGVWLDVDGNPNAFIEVVNSASVRVWGYASVRASDYASVYASGSASVYASGSASVHAWDSASVHAWDSASVYASGSASVHAWDSASVHARDSASVRAWVSASVHARDSASVYASSHVAVHRHSGRAYIEGGVLIDHTAIDLTDPQTWCDYHGVPVTDGVATVHKAVDDQWTTSRGINYAPGSTPEAPDWTDDHNCGGGLHFSPIPRQAQNYYPSATRFIAAGIALEDLRPILGGGTPKCKAPRVVVACREVTIDGEEVAG